MTLQLGVWASQFASFGHACCLRILCLAATVVAAEAAAQEATLWHHNGSIVALSANGARRQFHYRTPAADLVEAGVQPKTLLFDGRRDGNKYTGTAYVFSRVCGALPYAVAGPVSPDQRGVTMYGKAPIVDSSCSVIAHRDDVLIFSLSFAAQTADRNYEEQNTLQQSVQNQQTTDIEYERFLQQWRVCFADAQSLDVGIHACDSALSIQRGSLDDRVKLWQRRLELVPRQLAGKASQQTSGGSSPNSNSSPQSCGTGCSWCDTTTGLCIVPGDGPASGARTASSVDEKKATSVDEKRTTSIYRANEAALQTVAGLVVAALLACILWVRYGLANALTESGSSTTSQQSKAVLDQAAGKFDGTPDQLVAIAGEESASESPEAANVLLPPAQFMALKLKRSERRHLTGKIIFMLDARMDLNAEAHALIKRYGLGTRLVYESQTRERHKEATKEHLESTRDHPSWSAGPNAQLLGTGKTFYRLARAAVSATMAALSLRITVDGLIRGVHVECESMDELIGAEGAVREAAANLKGYLEEAATFDGREEIVEF